MYWPPCSLGFTEMLVIISDELYFEPISARIRMLLTPLTAGITKFNRGFKKSSLQSVVLERFGFRHRDAEALRKILAYAEVPKILWAASRRLEYLFHILERQIFETFRRSKNELYIEEL